MQTIEKALKAKLRLVFIHGRVPELAYGADSKSVRVRFPNCGFDSHRAYQTETPTATESKSFCHWFESNISVSGNSPSW